MDTRTKLVSERDALIAESDAFIQSLSTGVELTAQDRAEQDRRSYQIDQIEVSLNRLPKAEPTNPAPAADDDGREPTDAGALPDTLELSDHTMGLIEEAVGRATKDKEFRHLQMSRPAHNKQMLQLGQAAMTGTKLPKDFPRNAEGVPAVKLRMAMATNFFERMKAGFDKDYLVQLAYDSTTTGAHGLGDGIPTNVESAWYEIQEKVLGIRNIPGVEILSTGDSRPHDLPTFEEYSVTPTTPSEANLITGENVATVLREGDGAKVSTNPQEFSAMARVPRTLLMNSAPDVASKVTQGLAKTVLRMQEREFAIGSGGDSYPQGLFRNNTGNAHAQIAANSGPTVDEILAFVGSISPRETMGMPVMMFNYTTLYRNILSIKDGDDRFYFTDAMQGDMRRIFGVPVYTHTYAPTAVNASGSIFGLFFYPEAYCIHQAGDVELLMSNERFWDQKQVGYMAITYVDGLITEPNAVSVLEGRT